MYLLTLSSGLFVIAMSEKSGNIESRQLKYIHLR
jgi:hypothetical protein